MLFRPYAVLCALALSPACSGRAAVDGGADDAAVSDAGSGDASRSDAARTDAGTTDDSSVPLGDGGCPTTSAVCARPGAGFTRCGGGAIDPAAARAACDAVDPPLDLSMGLPKSCAAFSITSGHYEIWCGGGGEIYVWASFDALTSTDVIDCGFDVPLPDGGTVHGSSYELAWGLMDGNDRLYGNLTTSAGRSGGMLTGGSAPAASSDRAPDLSHWDGSLAIDGRLGVGAGVTSGVGTLYFTAAQKDCSGVPLSTGYQIVLAVPITWPS